jgi:hypothetical protein
VRLYGKALITMKQFVTQVIAEPNLLELIIEVELLKLMVILVIFVLVLIMSMETTSHLEILKLM